MEKEPALNVARISLSLHEVGINTSVCAREAQFGESARMMRAHDVSMYTLSTYTVPPDVEAQLSTPSVPQ